ncbi:MAG TPA: hypothetical protein DD640_02330 [Clostridiales bacterium]|nr:hypothetical protein [Clostridiales bacterium]
MVNALPKNDPSNSETGCCPRFQPEAWNEKTFVLDNMLFAKASARSVLHVPLNMNKVMAEAMKAIRAAGAELPDDYLVLSRDASPWRSDHFFRVTRKVPELERTFISGTFMTKVFEGPFNKVPQWMKDMEAYVASRGKKAEGFYAFYTTCPKCAEVYGKNYVVLFAKIG